MLHWSCRTVPCGMVSEGAHVREGFACECDCCTDVRAYLRSRLNRATIVVPVRCGAVGCGAMRCGAVGC